MKNQALFSSKEESKKLKCRLLQFLFGTWELKTVASAQARSCKDQAENSLFVTELTQQDITIISEIISTSHAVE